MMHHSKKDAWPDDSFTNDKTFQVLIMPATYRLSDQQGTVLIRIRS